MNQSMFVILLQIPKGGYRAGSRFTTSWDSTAGLPPGYFWLAAGVVLFLVLGTAKAFWDDRKWTGDVKKMGRHKRERSSWKLDDEDDHWLIRP